MFNMLTSFWDQKLSGNFLAEKFAWRHEHTGSLELICRSESLPDSPSARWTTAEATVWINVQQPLEHWKVQSLNFQCVGDLLVPSKWLASCLPSDSSTSDLPLGSSGRKAAAHDFDDLQTLFLAAFNRTHSQSG